ncbi:MAG: hypothetical protein JNK33_04950, partial [Candidatus Doudnabacteria bacterium]|nr:hypothetical protein [Candidatus Doudnabacteria bacterium]
MQKKYVPLLVLCGLLIAFFFRFNALNQMPGGLFPDEAANGLDINLMEQGHLQPFYERGNGREALFFYLIWGAVKIGGRTPLAHHATSALVGFGAVFLCYLATKKIFGYYSTQSVEEPDETNSSQSENRTDKATIVALLALMLMAASSWHTVLSRTAFRA